MTTILALWFGLALVVALWASTKEIGFIGGLIVSILLSPIAGFTFVILSPRKIKKAKM